MRTETVGPGWESGSNIAVLGDAIPQLCVEHLEPPGRGWGVGGGAGGGWAEDAWPPVCEQWRCWWSLELAN